MEVLTVEEVALRLHISERGVWRLLQDGVLPRIKIRRCTRVPLDAVADYLQRGGDES